MLGRNIKNILLLPADSDLREIQRLGIDFAIDCEFALLPELRGIHIGESQCCFIEVLAGAAVVVVIGDHVDA